MQSKIEIENIFLTESDWESKRRMIQQKTEFKNKKNKGEKKGKGFAFARSMNKESQNSGCWQGPLEIV